MALCKRIKELGHRILLVDPNENCPCRIYADKYLNSDIFDWDSVITFAKDNHAEAILSDECDIAMSMISKVGEHLGLSVQNSNVVRYFTNKYMMRELCKINGINHPEYQLCKTKEEAISFFTSLNKPIIIKPIDSNASHGVFKIESIEDIVTNFDESLSYSRIIKAVLAERYICGREFTIDGIKTPSQHYTLAISKKDHYKHNPNIANELYFSHDDPEFDYDKLKTINDKYILVSGLEYGFTHAEYKYEDGNFYLIEIASRGGGNMISSLITQYMSGYQTYDFLINSALGRFDNSDFSIRNEYKNRCSVLKFFDTPKGGGIVKKIIGEDYLKSCSEIKEYQLHFKIGDKIENCKNDSVRIGFYIACAGTREKLDRIIMDIDSSFKIIT